MLNELRPVIFEAEHSAVLLSDVSKMMREWVERQPTLTPPNEPERAGLYGKYTVYKNKDGSLVTDCFILRPAKDPAAVAALRAYADATDNAELAADIINWVGAEPNEQLTPETLKGMVREAGKPVVVWTVSLEDDGSLYLDSGEWEMFDGNDFSAPDTLDDLSHYGPRPHGYFVAYLRPPEGKEGGG